VKITHKIKQLEACKRLFKIEVLPEEIAIAYDEVYRNIQKEASIPGFRKGNAPRNLIEKEYKDYARKRVIERLVEESYHHAMREAGFYPVDLPKIENIQFPESGKLSFEATVEIRPQLRVKDYKALKIYKKSASVSEDEIEASLQNMRSLGASYKTVEPRPVKEGDFILCDMEWIVESKSVDKKSMVLLPVEKKTLTEPVFSGILGCNVGEKKSININIDKSFPKQEFVGKSGVLEIAIHEIKQKELPALDDEFAKDLGPFKSIENLREKISQRLRLQKEEESHIDVENQVVEQLLKTHSFELPQSLVEAELKNLLEDAKNRLLSEGYSAKDAEDIFQKEKDALAKKLQAHAEKQVKAFFILEAIAKEESLSATEEDLDKVIKGLASRQNKPPEQIRRQLEKEDKINSLYWQMTEAKVMQFLLDNAKVEEENK
jgi:trigger factor